MIGLRGRAKFLQFLFVAGVMALLLQLFILQVLDQELSSRADETTISQKEEFPSRGLIFDRNEDLLVENEAIYDLKVNYILLDREEEFLEIKKILGLTDSSFQARLEKDWNSSYFSKRKPYTFYPALSDVQYNLLQEQLHKYPAFFFEKSQKRHYLTIHAPHILGYLNEVNRDQVSAGHGRYNIGDFTGASGIEKQYENLLFGEKGLRYVLRDKYGREIADYRNGALNEAPAEGDDLILTLDIELQSFAEKLLQGKRGSIVALDPRNGELLCMASSPLFDPALLRDPQKRRKGYSELLTDPNKPLFDRSVLAKYPPGSIFKPFISLVALQLGVTHPGRYLPCSGMYYYNGVPFKCHQHPATTNIQNALAHSCNTYFRILLRDIVDVEGFKNPVEGLDTLRYFADHFGMGRRLGLDFPAESPGYMPDPALYDRMYPKDQGGWKSPTIMSIGIGQGEIEMTTLQMANLVAILANRGYYYTPHLLKDLKNRYFEKPAEYLMRHDVPIDREHFDPVIQGMERVIYAGTGHKAYVPNLSICGKTGTSQNPHGEDHSVFIAFAPVENPEIAIAVMVENAGAGNDVAAPMAGLVAEYYLKDSIPLNRTWLYESVSNMQVIQP